MLRLGTMVANDGEKPDVERLSWRPGEFFPFRRGLRKALLRFGAPEARRLTTERGRREVTCPSSWPLPFRAFLAPARQRHLGLLWRSGLRSRVYTPGPL